MSFSLKPLGPLGAEIQALDITKPLPDATVKGLINAWHDHLVLVVRQQPLSDHELAGFSRNFGDLEHAPIPDILKGTGHVLDTPEITVVSNVIVDNVPIGGLGDAEATWHTDMSYLESPPPGCLLHGLTIPPDGGDTWFTNMYLAYDSLPDTLRQRIEGLELKHDASTTSTGEPRRGFAAVTDVRDAPGSVHPLVITHPGSHRKALYLGRRLNAWIVGLSVDESEALLNELWVHCAQPEHTYRHKWSIGDLVMWDNRCTMHRRDSWTPGAPRILHRAQLKNSRVQ